VWEETKITGRGVEMVTDEKIPESVVIKLFDQAKESNQQNANAIRDLTRVVSELVKCIEKQPDLNVLASLSVNRSRDIEEIKTTMYNINNVSKKLLSRVIFMIAVVTITFSLMTASYFFVKGNIDNMVNQRVSEIHKSPNDDED